MRQTLQFLGLMACGLLLAGVAALMLSAGSHPRAVHGLAGVGSRSAAGIDYVSFAFGLATGLTLAEIARLSWADLPRRAVAWVLSKRYAMKYMAYGCIWLAVLIYI